MSFREVVEAYRPFDFAAFHDALTDRDIIKTLAKPRLDPYDYLTLLSPRAEAHLEAMAERARRETVRNFGRTMQLFTPMYIANHCINHCVYCGFNHTNAIARVKLSMEEISAEGREISKTGLKHVLVLTGESPQYSPLSYILEAVRTLRRNFTGIGIEIYPLDGAEYEAAARAGVDAMTLFQEVYDAELYGRYHPKGPKRDYAFRLDAPERACRAGIRAVNIGALLGLGDWRKEAFFTGLHADYLQRVRNDAEIAVSVPRIRPCAGGFTPPVAVEDRNIVQYITAFRIFMPRAGITLSSRESAFFRDRLVRLGITKISAGVTTAVGGHTKGEEVAQFDISDARSVDEIVAMLRGAGYQPVFKDWETLDATI